MPASMITPTATQMSESLTALDIHLPLRLPVSLWIEFYRPLNTKFVSKHPKIGTPRTIAKRHFNGSACCQSSEYFVGFCTGFRVDRYFRPVFVLVYWTHTF